MKLEFPDCFDEMFKDVRQELKKDLLLKLEVIKQSEFKAAATSKETDNKLKSKFAFQMLGGLQKEMSHKIGSDTDNDTPKSERNAVTYSGVRGIAVMSSRSGKNEPFNRKRSTTTLTPSTFKRKQEVPQQIKQSNNNLSQISDNEEESKTFSNSSSCPEEEEDNGFVSPSQMQQ